MALRLAIAGATGELGRAILSGLEKAELQLAEVHVLASAGSADETLMFNNRPLLVEELEAFDFSRADVALFAVPAAVARQFAPVARQAGCRVIDHSAAFRLEPDVPLLVEGMPVPAADLVACPGALTALLVPVLRCVQGVESAAVTVLTPVSATGRAGVRELAGQTGELLNGRGIEPVVYPVQIAFNALPALAAAAADQLMDELERLLPESYPVALAEVAVPVFYGLTVALSLYTQAAPDLEQLRQRFRAAGAEFGDTEENQGLVSPVTSAVGQRGLYVAGLQPLPPPLQGIQLWLVGDNLQQGAVRHSFAVLQNWIKDFKY